MASKRVIDFLLNHVTLPANLPQASDTSFSAGTNALVSMAISTARIFRSKLDGDNKVQYDSWSNVIRMLESYKKLHSALSLDKTVLKAALTDLDNIPVSTITLYFEPQNAALLIRKEKGETHVEAFEASPRATDTLAANRLIIRFPQRAVAIPDAISADVDFVEEFAAFLEKASVENIKDFQAVTLKAGSSAYESRDVANPVLMEALMALLEANGRLVSPQITRKNVRDDCLWADAEVPWRRSATWLVLRVAIQRALCQSLGGEAGHIHYKFFTALLLEQLSETAVTSAASASQLLHLSRKLARRFTKLELEKGQTTTVTTLEEYRRLFATFSGRFKETLTSLNDLVEANWAKVRKSSRKTIPAIPRFTTTLDLSLSLNNSSTYLSRVMQSIHNSRVQPVIPVLHEYSRSRRAVSQKITTEHTLYTYMDLTTFEKSFADGKFLDPSPGIPRALHCQKLADVILDLFTTSLNAYAGMPAQLSSVALAIMEVWVALDRHTLTELPLLAQYPVPFPSNILDDIQAPTLQDMRRVGAVERYLAKRHSLTVRGLPSIFDDPRQD